MIQPRFLPGALLGLVLAGTAAAGEIAVTVDDLPLSRMADSSVAGAVEVNRRLVGALEAAQVPAVGFVNEGKLEIGGRVSAELVAVLEHWLNAGLELGNHGYAHLDLHRVAAAAFIDDVARGERLTRPLAESRGSPYRYFRYPYLHTGRGLAVRDRVRKALNEAGYTIAPVTIDNSEWIFALAYDRAHAAGDDALKERLGREYVAYMMRKTVFFERNARDLFERDIPQVLLIHANRLNADWFAPLASALTAEGRRFVALEAALSDPAYGSANTWTGAGGISWLHRWAITAGASREFFRDEPATPGWVLDTAGVDAE